MRTGDLVDLAEIGDGDLALVGGKALGLARLVRAGVPVPPGVCITTSADPSSLREALRERIEEYGVVAVRSSATAEDWPDLSFAGQHDSVLGVRDLDACIEAIRTCRRSLWSERAVAYRERQGISDAGLAMAVIVQRLVPAEFSGVAFTADPVTGRGDRIVIEATSGPGDALVSGRVTPARMLFQKSTLSLAERTGEIEIDEKTVRRVAALSLKAEGLFGVPVDVEWAVHRGKVWLLQARPITALPDTRQVWTNSNTGEVLPDVVTPMTWSITELFGGQQDASVLDGIEILPEHLPEVRTSTWGVLRKIPGLLWEFLAFAPDRGARVLDRLDGLTREVEAADASASAVHRAVRDLLEASELFESIGIAVLYETTLYDRCRKWFGDDGCALASRLLQGLGNNENADAGLALWRLARQADEHACVRAALTQEAGFAEARHRMVGDPEGDAFLAAWDEFMAVHGHHCRGELELFNPRWSETPDAILEQLRSYLDAGPEHDLVERHERLARTRAEAVAECRRRLRNPLERALLAFLVTKTRAAPPCARTPRAGWSAASPRCAGCCSTWARAPGRDGARTCSSCVSTSSTVWTTTSRRRSPNGAPSTSATGP